jgi:hypothetical protein
LSQVSKFITAELRQKSKTVYALVEQGFEWKVLLVLPKSYSVHQTCVQHLCEEKKMASEKGKAHCGLERPARTWVSSEDNLPPADLSTCTKPQGPSAHHVPIERLTSRSRLEKMPSHQVTCFLLLHIH